MDKNIIEYFRDNFADIVTEETYFDPNISNGWSKLIYIVVKYIDSICYELDKDSIGVITSITKDNKMIRVTLQYHEDTYDDIAMQIENFLTSIQYISGFVCEFTGEFTNVYFGKHHTLNKNINDFLELKLVDIPLFPRVIESTLSLDKISYNTKQLEFDM